jgi:cytosine/adenosine deaminase-related metal-dependent hydrolase
VTIVRGGNVLTMGPAGDFRDGAVVLSAGSGTIQAVGPFEEVLSAFPDAPVVGDERDIVLPGFINGHDHLSEALISGLGETLNLYEWIERVIRPVGPFLDFEKARVGTLLKGIEMLQSGITCVNDMFVHRNPGSNASLGVVDGLQELGMRGVVSFGADDLPDRVPIPVLMAEHEALARLAADTELIEFRMGISTIQTQSDELLDVSIAAARRRGTGQTPDPRIMLESGLWTTVERFVTSVSMSGSRTQMQCANTTSRSSSPDRWARSRVVAPNFKRESVNSSRTSARWECTFQPERRAAAIETSSSSSL